MVGEGLVNQPLFLMKGSEKMATYIFPSNFTLESSIDIQGAWNGSQQWTRTLGFLVTQAAVQVPSANAFLFTPNAIDPFKISVVRPFQINIDPIYCANYEYINTHGTSTGDNSFLGVENLPLWPTFGYYSSNNVPALSSMSPSQRTETFTVEGHSYTGFGWASTPSILVITTDSQVYFNGKATRFNWKSIKSLSLASIEELGFSSDVAPLNNQTTRLISYIPDDDLNDGNVVVGGNSFVQKAPSLDDFITQYGSQDFSSKNIFLKNKNYVIIGRKNAGLGGSQYKFTFLSKFDPASILPQITYYETTINVGLSDGIPYLGFIIDEENEVIKLNIIYIRTIVDQTTGIKTKVADYNTISMTTNEMGQLYAWFNESYGYEEENDSGAENPDQGGNETDAVVNDPLNRITLPTKGATGSGFIKLYEVTTNQMQDLCNFMWDDSLIANLGRLFEDPRELIVSLMVFPISPDNTTTTHIYAGNLDTGVDGNLLATEYLTRYAGSLKVPKGNSDFMSFAPYRRMTLICPYCEEVELDPSAVYGATLRLYYHLSFFSGNCVVEVTREFDDGIEAPFMFVKGQIGFSVPLSSVDYTRVYSSLISSGLQIGMGIVSANPQGMVSGLSGLIDGSCAPRVMYKGAGGASHGALGCQQPYIVFEDVIPAYDGTQPQYIGNTFYKTKLLDDCDGYTKCFEAHIEGVHATDSELEEIMSWLTKGVIIHHNGSATPSDTPSVSGNTVINFMKLTSEVNVIGKSWTDVTPIEGKLIFDQSISNPSILVNSSALGFNYVYIGLFNRFYFVSDIIARNTDLIEIRLKSDPLQSFKDEILNSYASVDRQKSNGNKFLHDPYMWTQVNKNVNTVSFSEDGISFDWGHSSDTYILAIAGT